MFKKEYYFNYYDFDEIGVEKHTECLFVEIIIEWEKDFNHTYPFCFANFLFSNESTMLLLKRCFDDVEREDFGMELINGQIDFETNFLIDDHSSRTMVYAIGSRIKNNGNYILDNCKNVIFS